MMEQIAGHILIPQNLEKTVWTGLIKVHGEEMCVHLELPPNKNISHASVWGDWKLEQYLARHRGLLESRLQSATDPDAFLVELCSLLESTASGRPETSSPFQTLTDDSSLYSKIVAEIEEIGWDRVTSIESHLRQLELQCFDSSGMAHTVKIQLHQQYPSVAPVCSACLPGDFELQWTSKCKLSDVMKQFECMLKKYRTFWDEMSELDCKTWILEPEKPGPSDVMRRIALGNNSSVQIMVNPHHPRMLPQCRFLGADHVINPLCRNLNRNLQSWDSHVSLVANLQNVLEVDFPAPSETQQQDFNEECGICYSYRLDSAIPEHVCDNPQCNKPFHQTCLYEWLRSLPSSHQTMAGIGANTLYGECPYCAKPISMKKVDRR